MGFGVFGFRVGGDYKGEKKVVRGLRCYGLGVKKVWLVGVKGSLDGK